MDRDYAQPHAPLALASLEFEFDVVDGIRWPVLAGLLLFGDELFSEGVVVGLFANLVNYDFLLIIGDLVDDVFWTAATKLELVESGNAVWIDGESGRFVGLERNEGAGR